MSSTHTGDHCDTWKSQKTATSGMRSTRKQRPPNQKIDPNRFQAASLQNTAGLGTLKILCRPLKLPALWQRIQVSGTHTHTHPLEHCPHSILVGHKSLVCIKLFCEAVFTLPEEIHVKLEDLESVNLIIVTLRMRSVQCGVTYQQIYLI